ncbi:hypothetical protein [Sphingomonas turrisvirgatae]|uniref:Glycosyltransferase RgtA/B/C/D-like domain-containing protein n=1 Tax=Sphingomonas turrisvirgatae TaxID=1888892 RepID=A0A1E3LW93_9SPHN|nr:hypothetical protein [Sphingomonas turrisvirgatae]ODP38091.1 hypothetical protein BFL28_15855 [Sphingomonas turrisvirgatae]
MNASANRWWESRLFMAAAVVLAVVPLLWPALPPLADLPGHIGRYHIASAIDASPELARHWQVEWALIGNLGVDLLVHALTPFLGVELGARIVVMAIPPLFVSGLVLVSIASGRRLSPAAAFAFPLAYSFPFQFGFVNFMLSAGLALHALALWIWLGSRNRIALRTGLFVPISWILWIAHSSGWGLFGLLAFATEAVRLRRTGCGWLAALFQAGLACLPLALPLIWMVSGTANGEPVEWGFKAKAGWFPSLLRERWKLYDVVCAIVLFSVLWMAIRDRRLRFEPVTGGAGLIAFVAFLAMPRLALGGSYVDMRLLAPAVALALVAIHVRPGNERFEHRLALAAVAFLALRTTTSTFAMAFAAMPQQQALEVTPHIPRGAAVLVLVNEPCSSQWVSRRLGHIAGVATARRDIFENSQWTLGGQQLLRHRHPQADPYTTDPAQLVYPAKCEYRTTDFATALREFDRGTFTHVWTIDFPARRRLARDVRLVWSNGVSALYAVERVPG